MRMNVRTTVVIDDEIMRQAKRRAAEEGISVSEVLNRALRDALSPPPRTEPLPPFRMVTFGRGAGETDHQPEDFVRLLEEEEKAAQRDS